MGPTHCKLCVPGEDVLCTARFKTYPDGTVQILACDRAIFGANGWEDMDPPKVKGTRGKGRGDLLRSVRRARAQVRDLALCTPFRYFVTLTLDGGKVDRYDMAAITKKLRVWADNRVRREGLAYVLVPELHKDGAVHFHGFFNDALPVADSGTMTADGWKRPRRPRSAAQRAQWAGEGARPVYNLPDWSLGFTTAIELYGPYPAAVSYVCKYIGKGLDGGTGPPGHEKTARPSGKIGGRWYYSGGALGRPAVTYGNLDLRDAEQMEGAYSFSIPDAGLSFVQVYTREGGVVNDYHNAEG